MIAIREIASYIPPCYQDNTARAGDQGYTVEFLDSKIGTRKVSRMSAGMDTADMCLEALGLLERKASLEFREADCIVVCTQNPQGHGIPHTSAVIHGKLGAPSSCATFDISLGCSGYVYSLSVVKSFMEANGLSRGLLFTADPYSKILDPDDITTGILFGDGATVTFLGEPGHDTNAWKPRSFRFYSDGKTGKALNNDSGKLDMNGRAVLRFSATTVPSEVKALLTSAGLGKDEIDLYLFHQGSKHIIDTLVRRLELPEDKVPLNLAWHGNTVSSAIPMILEDQWDRPNCNKILLCGFGVGLSIASCILDRHGSPGE